VALEMVAQAPDRIERLALLGCNARATPPDKAAARRATIAVAEREGIESSIAGVWDASVPAWRYDDQSFRVELEAMALATPLPHFRDQIEIAINRVDSRPRLGKIDVPTLVACGEEDRVCPPELSVEIAAAIPGATLAILERAGHYLTLDQPEAVARLLRDWLAMPTPIRTRRISKEFS
jgi:pimeloyl-ACP methyl ester carboxylesterase